MLNEYSVVARPFYREQKPMLFTILADNEKEAIDIFFKNRDVKETLDVKLSSEIEWNENTINEYWNLYK